MFFAQQQEKPNMMKNKTTQLLSLSVIICTLINIYSCGSYKSKKPKSMPPLTIESSIAYTAPVNDKIWFATSTRPQYSVTIEPRIAGYLDRIHFSGGDYIHQGERLFTIDPSQINTTLYSAQASLESAEAQEVEARNNYERAVPLSEIDAISQSSLDGYRAKHTAAKSAVRSASEQLRSANLNLSYTKINAPISGIIAQSPANEGDYVGVGTKFSTLTTLSSTDTLEVDLSIPVAKYLKYTPLGATPNDKELLSDITLIMPDSSIYSQIGQYAYTKKDAASESSTVVIVAKIANLDNLLKPNMFARISANIGEPRNRVLIPQSAVSQIQGISSVWVIKPDTTVTLRRVTLGVTYGDKWEVKSGVTDGERVATSGSLKLHEGVKVKLSPTK